MNCVYALEIKIGSESTNSLISSINSMLWGVPTKKTSDLTSCHTNWSLSIFSWESKGNPPPFPGGVLVRDGRLIRLSWQQLGIEATPWLWILTLGMWSLRRFAAETQQQCLATGHLRVGETEVFTCPSARSATLIVYDGEKKRCFGGEGNGFFIKHGSKWWKTGIWRGCEVIR